MQLCQENLVWIQSGVGIRNSSKYKGKKWTQENMEEMLQKIIDNTNNKLKPHEMKEVKFKQILDVDPSLFIMPPLHIKLELVNWAFIKSDGYIYFP